MKKILLAVTIVALLTSALPARQWTSRTGGFSVEAELVDVKNGEVILKKADGKLVTVPLNKLSLGDIRYINEAFKTAEAAVIGGPSAPEADDQPQSSSKKTAVPADVEKLQYRWQKGQQYVYRVRIAADRGDYSEYIKGQVTYKVQSITDDEIELSMTKKLAREYKPNLAGTIICPDPDRKTRFLLNLDVSRDMTITIDPRGRVLYVEGRSQFPYLLGDLSQWIIEPLGTPVKGTWTVANDTGMVIVPRLSSSARYVRVHDLDSVPATEKIVYSIQRQNGPRIAVNKHYRLETASMIDGKPRLEAIGDGRLAFDVERRIPASLRFDARITIREVNRTEEIPFHVSYRLLSEEDLAEAAKAAEEKKQEAERIRKEKERPLNPAELETALAELTSGDVKQMGDCLKRLVAKKPKQPNPKIAQALESVMLTSEHGGLRSEAAQSLVHWSTPESVPSLLKGIKDEWAPVAANAIEALRKYMPKEAIKPVARLLVNPFTRGSAEKFLKAAGPDAEDAVLMQIDTHDDRARATVCNILRVIGTKKSIPALEKAVTDRSWIVNRKAREALDAIKSRQ